MLGTRNVIRAKIYIVDFGLVSTETVIFRAKYGTTTFAGITIDLSATISSVSGYLLVDLIANNSASAQVGSAQIILSGQGGEVATDATVNLSKVMGAATGTATENSATALNLTITAQYNGTNAANDLSVPYGYVEVIRQ
jgi:hypothetical protein